MPEEIKEEVKEKVTPGKLTGPQKAAIILITLGEDIASEVMKYLDPDEIKIIVEEISKIDYIPPEISASVIKEFYEIFSKDVMTGGKEKAIAFIRTVIGKGGLPPEFVMELEEEEKHTLEILRNADPFALFEVLKNDTPQTIAIVLRILSPVKSARILRNLPEEMREAVIKRMTKIDDVQPSIISRIARTLCPKLRLATSKEEIRRSSGIGVASTILSYVGGEQSKKILEAVDKVDHETAEKMRELIFTFDDIPNLDDRSMQRVLREIDRRDLAIAFKAASEKVRNKILSNLSERAREEFTEEYETLGPVRLTDVEEAQRKIVETIRRLDEQGEITIVRGEELL